MKTFFSLSTIFLRSGDLRDREFWLGTEDDKEKEVTV